MNEFKVTVKIQCVVEAEDADSLAADLQRKAECKEELQMLVQAWMNQRPKEG